MQTFSYFSIDIGKKNALIVPQVRAGQITTHKDLTSERLQNTKEKDHLHRSFEGISQRENFRLENSFGWQRT